MAEITKLKRFWDEVTLFKGEDGYEFYLDKHLLRLPQKTVLKVKELSLANKIVEEWKRAGEGKKGGSFSYNSLPMTRIAGTMIEKVAPDRQIYINALLPYVNGDLLCYRAERPHELVNEQKEKWDPIVHGFEEKFQVSLKTGYGIMPLVQMEETIRKIKIYLNELSDGELAAYAVLVPLLGSMILTIALSCQEISPETAFDFAYLDETVQSRIWGEDQEEKDRLDKIKIEIQEGADFLFLIKGR